MTATLALPSLPTARRSRSAARRARSAGPRRANRIDWSELARGLCSGESEAAHELGRCVTRMLNAWRAHDFHADWADLAQEVLIAVTLAVRERKVRDARALPGYVRSVARNKFNDRLREHARLREDEAVEWDEIEESHTTEAHAESTCHDTRVDVRRALEQLPAQVAALVYKVYGERKTYEAAAAEAGVPLGTAKRQLREGLAVLRDRLACEG